MDYRIKRIFGTLFVTALSTGTAHAQAAPQQVKMSAFTTEQLFRALPTAQTLCLEEGADGYDCEVASTIANELLKRGALRDAHTSTIDKLRTIVIIDEDCLRAHICADDEVMLVNTLATQLNFNHVMPDDFMRAYEAWYGQLHALGPMYAPVLDHVYMNVQQARANGL